MAYLLSFVILFCGLTASAEINTSRPKNRDTVSMEQRIRDILTQDQRIMIYGFRKATQRFGQIIPSTARCSDGWQESDYIHQVGQVCTGKLCFSVFAREPSEHKGVIFTCHFGLADGTYCKSQTYSDGYSMECIDLNAKTYKYRISNFGWITQKDVRPVISGL